MHIAIDSTVVTASHYETTRKFDVVAGRVVRDGKNARRFVCVVRKNTLAYVLVRAALEQSGWVNRTEVEVVNDGAPGMRAIVEYAAPKVAAPLLDWFHISMMLRAIETPLKSLSYDYRNDQRPAFMDRCVSRWQHIRHALWRGKADKAIELAETLIATIEAKFPTLKGFYASSASTAHRATQRLVRFLQNNRDSLCDYQQARKAGRRISTAQAESVMNHLINRRLSKKQQMRWSMKGAHGVLLTRVQLLDGQLENHFRDRYTHFRSPEFPIPH